MYFWFYIIIITLAFQCFSSQKFLYSEETNLFSFLKHLCKNQFNLHYNLFLTTNVSNNSAIKSFLNKNHCNLLDFNTSFLNSSINNLKYLIKHKFKYTKLKLIFIFSFYQVTQNLFDNILLNQSTLYSICDHCFPIINIFSTSKLASFYIWTSNIFPQLSNNFQSNLLIFDNNLRKQSIFIRPILDNCYLYNGLFVPISQTDFNRLNIDFHKCNLSGQTLNISVNYV